LRAVLPPDAGGARGFRCWGLRRPAAAAPPPHHARPGTRRAAASSLLRCGCPRPRPHAAARPRTVQCGESAFAAAGFNSKKQLGLGFNTTPVCTFALSFNKPFELTIKPNHPSLGAGGRVRLYPVNLYPNPKRALSPHVSRVSREKGWRQNSLTCQWPACAARCSAVARFCTHHPQHPACSAQA
jgi:hypothetical protein